MRKKDINKGLIHLFDEMIGLANQQQVDVLIQICTSDREFDDVDVHLSADSVDAFNEIVFSKVISDLVDADEAEIVIYMAESI